MNEFNILESIPTKVGIDVYVPTHNRLDLTIGCINTLYENTGSPFHLIVVDDSTDLTPQWFEALQGEHQNITFIHSTEPYKSGNQMINIALKYGGSPYLACVMNSVRVEPEWEVVALSRLEQDPKIGIVGLKTLFGKDTLMPGLIESAGITIIGFTPFDLGRNYPSHRLTVIYECPAVQWAFCIIRKEAVGVLPEDIYNGFRGWDDVDNSLTLAKNGWKVLFCGYGVGYHTPKATRGDNSVEEMIASHQNAEIFYKRWGYWDEYQKAQVNKNPLYISVPGGKRMLEILKREQRIHSGRAK